MILVILKINQISPIYQSIRMFETERVSLCAQKEIRTPILLRVLPPEGSASTSFAIWAFLAFTIVSERLKLDNESTICNY